MKALILLCALSIPAGWHHCILTSHYLHLYPQDGEISWSSTTGIWVEGPTTIYASSPGIPMGHEWVMDMMLAGECGTIPDPNQTRIFVDGFETGDISMWGPNGMRQTRQEFDDP